MKPDPRFIGLEKTFWAHVRSISEKVHYSDSKTKEVKTPVLQELAQALRDTSLSSAHLFTKNGKPSKFGKRLQAYFAYRAEVLNNQVRPLLMNKTEAAKLFELIRKQAKSKIPVPMNKQKGNKKKPAYLTAMVNMLINDNRKDLPFDVDPRQLTSVTHNKMPVRTLARRIDGAFPSVINPVAIWEIKEYYHTTTFGSRVADGVYETLLDGMELEELSKEAKVNIRHYLILDAKYTWWECGRSYLCRVIDMMHMGYVDEVLFGREVVKRLPTLVRNWRKLARLQSK